MKKVYTSHGKHVCNKRLISEKRALRQGAELPDYARYNHLRLFCGQWVDKSTVSGITRVKEA